MPREGSGLLWKINGADTDLHLTAASGHLQTLTPTLQITKGSGRDC